MTQDKIYNVFIFGYLWSKLERQLILHFLAHYGARAAAWMTRSSTGNTSIPNQRSRGKNVYTHTHTHTHKEKKIQCHKKIQFQWVFNLCKKTYECSYCEKTMKWQGAVNAHHERYSINITEKNDDMSHINDVLQQHGTILIVVVVVLESNPWLEKSNLDSKSANVASPLHAFAFSTPFQWVFYDLLLPPPVAYTRPRDVNSLVPWHVLHSAFTFTRFPPCNIMVDQIQQYFNSLRTKWIKNEWTYLAG